MVEDSIPDITGLLLLYDKKECVKRIPADEENEAMTTLEVKGVLQPELNDILEKEKRKKKLFPENLHRLFLQERRGGLDMNEKIRGKTYELVLYINIFSREEKKKEEKKEPTTGGRWPYSSRGKSLR